MRRWAELILTTLFVTSAVMAAVVGIDWVWHTAPGSAPVAAVVGDPRVHLATRLPRTPPAVPVFEVGSEVTPAQVEAVLAGKAQVRDGWINWKGRSALSPTAAMDAIDPAVKWRTEGNFLGPAAKGVRVRTAGLSSAFTGTDVVSNSFGIYQTNGGYLTYLSIPAHRLKQVGTTKVIPAAVALLDVRHHRASTRLLPDTVPLLPQRLAGASISGIGPITDVWLTWAADPRNPGRSKPIWVFEPIAEADAQR